ncbi:signal peptidase I [Bacillus thuringiensis]|uniref:signal peptidase I n=1 Tax=Bacillus thuringiensis TaxID=1428 RepID=UPI0021D67378|nr:signal peptidase I [Bacillus thuringiensis]MCU7679215.1 signal peptidase I [Bacillus thuringiensis]
MKKKNLIEFLQISTFVIAIAILLLRFFVFFPYSINGESMAPTIHNNERVLVNKVIFQISSIKRFDIVAIQTESSNKNLVKRIIGLPGERLEYKKNTLYINGQKVEDPFNDNTKDFSLINTYNFKKIPSDKYFVLGDNRPFSHDSRSLDIGLISKSEIKGKIQFRFSPLDTFSLF